MNRNKTNMFQTTYVAPPDTLGDCVQGSEEMEGAILEQSRREYFNRTVESERKECYDAIDKDGSVILKGCPFEDLEKCLKPLGKTFEDVFIEMSDVDLSEDSFGGSPWA